MSSMIDRYGPCCIDNIRRLLLYLIAVLQTATICCALISIIWICFLNKNTEIEAMYIFNNRIEHVYLYDIILVQMIYAFCLRLWLMGLQWLSDAISFADNKKCDNWCEARTEFINKLLSKLATKQNKTQINQHSDLKQEYQYYVNSKYYCTNNISKK